MFKQIRFGIHRYPRPLPKDGDVKLLVSSRHMILASRVLKAMLRGPFIEGQTLRESGEFEIALSEDDTIAFIILMDIVHGRTSRVPRTVTLNLLTTLSLLVDKYELLEAVDVF